MNYVIVHEEINILICKECKFVIIFFRINIYFSGEPHQLNSQIRKKIENDISSFDNIININEGIKFNIENLFRFFDNS